MSISREQALDCLRSDDLIGIGMEADAVRRRLHPEGVVGYGIAATLHCEGLAAADVCARAIQAEAKGASGVTLSGGNLAAAIASVKRQLPEMWVQAALADAALLPELCDAGIDTVIVHGVDAAALALHRAAHAVGMRTSATMIFGAGETFEDRIARLEAVRHFQEETAGFATFAPISHHTDGGRELDEATAVEYLKTLAVSRMMLEGIDTVESDWQRQGLKVLQMGLRFGANDAGALRVDLKSNATEEEIRRVIRDSGFQPAERDLGFRAMMLG